MRPGRHLLSGKRGSRGLKIREDSRVIKAYAGDKRLIDLQCNFHRMCAEHKACHNQGQADRKHGCKDDQKDSLNL